MPVCPVVVSVAQYMGVGERHYGARARLEFCEKCPKSSTGVHFGQYFALRCLYNIKCGTHVGGIEQSSWYPSQPLRLRVVALTRPIGMEHS